MTQALNLANFANFLNTSGQVSAAGIQYGVLVPTGSNSLFYNSTAPLGYTQLTSLNDYSLRIVSGFGGTTGGTTAFSTVFANQTPTISTSGLSASATTLSTAQMPSHSHSVPSGGTVGYPSCNETYTLTAGGSRNDGGQTTGGAGSGGSHTHSISGSVLSSAITLNVQYANFILCSKN